MTAHYLLISGPDSELLKKYLKILAKIQDLKLTVLVFTDEVAYNSLFSTEIYLNYKHLSFQNGAYAGQAQSRFIEVLSLNSNQASEIKGHYFDKIVLCPEQLWLDPPQSENINILVTPVQSTFIDHLQLQDIQIDEQFMADVLELKELPTWHSLEEFLSMAEACAQEALAFSQAEIQTHWQSAWGERYRSLNDMALWRYRLIYSGRDLLNQAIGRVQALPTDWACQLILLLYRRYDRALPQDPPAWLSPFFETLEKQAYLHILPAVTDFTVTIALVTYNRVGYLKRAVEGVLKQTYTNWKLIIINHGSTDGTKAYCDELTQLMPDKINVIHREHNLGTGHLPELWQLLIETCSTELVILSADDDWLLPHHLENTVPFFQAHPWLGMVAGGYIAIRPDQGVDFQYGPFYETNQIIDTQKELQRALLSGVCPQSCIYRKSVLPEFVKQDVLFCLEGGKFALWDFMVTTKLLSHFEVGYISDILAGFTVDSGTAFSGKDFTYELAVLMEEVCKDYNSLFGKNSYPREIIQNYIYNVLFPMNIQHFQHILLNANTADDLENGVLLKKERWKKFVEAKNSIFDIVGQNSNLLLEFLPK